MRPAVAVVQQTWALHFQTTEDGSERKVMVAFAGARTATIETLLVRRQASGGLALDHELLDAFENCFAFGQSEAERFRLYIRTFHGCDFAGLRVAIVGNYDYLQFEDHGCTLRSCPSAWSWRLACRLSNRWGWKS